MQKRNPNLTASLLAVCLLFAGAPLAAAPDDLAKRFAQPPNAAKPRVYWWWLMSLVSKEGLTKDLEEMAAKGIGGVLIFDASGAAGPMPRGPAFMTPGWRENFKHALREADRLGLEVSVNLCSGWDAGGPWITPDHASKHFQQSELDVTGPRKFSGQLPKPVGDTPAYRELAIGVGTRPSTPLSAEMERYREVAVQAVRRQSAAGRRYMRITASSAQSAHLVEKAVDGIPGTFWVSGGYKPGDAPTRQKPEWICLEFDAPFTARSLNLMPRDGYGQRRFELQVGDEKGEFRTVQHFELEHQGSDAFEFPETTARMFRILITASHAEENVQIRELAFPDMPPAISPIDPLLALKSGRDSCAEFGEKGPVRALVEAPLAPLELDSLRTVISPHEIIDLTDKVGPDGTLEWEVPPGEWTIIRTGFGYNNDQVMVASPGAAGPSVDFLSKAATEFHWKHTAEILLEDAGPLAGKTLKYFHVDSWEAGLPNWTDSFLEDFEKYRGYDARPYLPVLAGHIITSEEVSDRFLYDFRKTIGDCLADNHCGRLAELAHARGVQTHCEAGGPCYPRVPPLDALKNLGRTDIPMGEFWQSAHWQENGQNIAGKQTASAAHIYGKTYAAAEAFTKMGPHWEESFAEMKPPADRAFCEGINRFFLHQWTSTRPEDGLPGYEYFAGTHFNRNVTWWPQAGAFFSYISRCQYLLQQGLFVADVCYYYGDNTPNQVEVKQVDPSLGPGYDYDVCNAEVLLTRMEARDGRIVLPDGMSYRLLVLPDRRTMPVEVLRKIKSLVEAGATVVGPKPERDPGLKNYPQCDAEVKRAADELWGGCDGESVKEHRYGAGRVYWGKPLREILLADGVPPSFTYQGGSAKTFLDFIQRRAGDTEIYFVCNRNGWREAVEATFRVSSKQPELWDALTGEMRPAVAFRQEAGRTIVPLEFEPYGSTFVIFRKPIAATAAGKQPRNYPVWTEPFELIGGWDVAFDPKWGGPESVRFETLVNWTSRAEPGIQYYSGKATYRKTFDVPDAMSKPGRLRLNLGEVKNVAEVRLNGKHLGVAWAEPFQVEITDAVKARGNRLEVDVVNLWPNRMIGDAALPQEQRFTRSNVAMRREAKLLDSGLLGPVTLQTAR
jgi:hypothetical protein